MSSLLNRTLFDLSRRISANGLVLVGYNEPEGFHQSNNHQKNFQNKSAELDRILSKLDLEDEESGHVEWQNAMRMVARLPGDIPATFRRKLWIKLANRNIRLREIDWEKTSAYCFNRNDPFNDNDANFKKLEQQIIRDLNRTGCHLFSDKEKDNQELLKQVLLAYAKFNQDVGYCQGFNMLAALILEVFEGNVQSSLKVMIMLIEDVLPESYFANNLQGLSVDMLVFRDLMHFKLPCLARHLDRLQQESYDSKLGVYYEPPLVNAFTMQWFLTLFTNCLPKATVLRIWDLILLEGNEILLRTALAIWDSLADRILLVENVDSFYGIMDVLTRDVYEFGSNANQLVFLICNMASFPFPHLNELRETYSYNIGPLSSSIINLKNGIKDLVNCSVQKLTTTNNSTTTDDDAGNDSTMFSELTDLNQNWIEERFVMINWYLNNAMTNVKIHARTRKRGKPSVILPHSTNQSHQPSSSSSSTMANNHRQNNSNKTKNGKNLWEYLVRQIQTTGNDFYLNSFGDNNNNKNLSLLNISMLKKQYLKMRQRQHQAQIIIADGLQYSRSKQLSNEKVKLEANKSMEQLAKNPITLRHACSQEDEDFSVTQLLIKNTNHHYHHHYQNHHYHHSMMISNQPSLMNLGLNQTPPPPPSSPLPQVIESNNHNIHSNHHNYHQQSIRNNFNGRSVNSTATTAIQKLSSPPQTPSLSMICSPKKSYQRSNTVNAISIPTNISVSGTGSTKNVANVINPAASEVVTTPPILASLSIRSPPPQCPLSPKPWPPSLQRVAKQSSSSSTSTELCDEAMGIDCQSDDDDEYSNFEFDYSPTRHLTLTRQYSKSLEEMDRIESLRKQMFSRQSEESSYGGGSCSYSNDQFETRNSISNNQNKRQASNELTPSDDDVFGSEPNMLEKIIQRFQDQINEVKIQQNMV